jgi:hypothetical protein
LAIAAGVITIAALARGAWQLVCGSEMEAANWVMAAGGMGIFIFSTVQLHRDAQREAERLAGARAKLKPVAWLARRMCEQAVIESNEKRMKEWLVRWYSVGAPYPIDLLETRMRDTVTFAAEAAGDDVRAADTAFEAFIAAANILNALNAANVAGAEEIVYQAAVPRARLAATHLANAARALVALAPRATEEPAVPVTSKFRDEG